MCAAAGVKMIAKTERNVIIAMAKRVSQLWCVYVLAND